MGSLALIIKREYKARVSNRSFIIMTFLSPLIVVGMIMLITYLTQLNQAGKQTIVVVDESGLFYKDFESTAEIDYLDLSPQGLDTAKDLVEEQNYFGLLYIPENVKKNTSGVRFYGNEAPGISTIESIEEQIETKLTNEKLLDRGVDLDLIDASETLVSITIEDFSGERTSKISNWIKAGFGGGAGYLLMMFIIIYGNMVMRSVIEEKTNRIIEVIISSVKPFKLMMGKIMGTTLAGITQFMIWLLIGGGLLTFLTLFLGLDANTPNAAMGGMATTDLDKIELILLDVLNLPLLKLACFFLIYFIGGYFLYSSIYAAIGAAVDSETDTQQFMLPIIMPLMLAIYVGFFAVIENPDGSIATIFSMIPLTSPIVMLMRIPFGVPWWQLALSVGILIATFIFTVWFGSKIYRVGILMYGKKPTYKEILKWIKY
ncbi:MULTISPECIES: ABC transporter permease [Leeuwenhoekiella]|uniref:ABC-2 type transport system permease protein n=1 Tax=Leeuwenhoekiella palythoae TaxID=573501 RepID=A0A1M5Z1A8_9FLAO|nr:MULTISPECIES: ABC transporter permease [Leeuwenhoekiella]MBH12291.1 ABC transporter permease [Leeuwenhoekiella sp.]MEC7782997.1 ABC transporter permease [Bacteroidota bacterium]MEE3149270.1 ABC transporter permease [Bacteroidota bacterium]RXG29781.1 ABC-2 type transport system permease protein [Leeuwenhoekiella palythoae]UBZ11188.1 ABC transporter permease [Leeuwenhoekiella palythoae]|tara:strand:+ start:5644 stop:6933 length:1290 start_codon:yes stop_codon:yes gene_type:complete